MKCLTRLWHSIKNKFVPPPPLPPPTPRPDKSDLEYENILMELLEEVEQGSRWGSLEGFLIAKYTDKVQLAKWLGRFGVRWQEQPESHQELGKRLLLLAEVAQGELAQVAKRLGESLRAATDRDNSDSLTRVPLSRNDEDTREAEISEQGDNLEIINNQNHSANMQPPITTSLNSEENQEEDTLSEVQKLYQLLDTLDTSTNNQVSSPTTNIQPPIPNPSSSIPNSQPDDHEAWNNRGIALYRLGQLEEAIASYDQALKFKPDYHEVWFNRGLALSDLGKLEEAIASYDQALKFKPDYHEALVNRGLALSDLGKLEEAIASYDQALKFKPDDDLALVNRGNALSDLGKLEEAIASYDQALKFKPDHHEAWNGWGLALYKLGKLEEAIASYDQALKFKPDHHLDWYNRGFALYYLGKLEEAIVSYEQALKIKPDFHQAWLERGIALFDLGKLEEAIASYDQALKIKPDFHQAWINRGSALYQLGQYEEAIACYDQALKIKPDFHQAWENRGSALYQLGQYEEAIASYDQALKIKPDDHQAWFNRSNAVGKSLGCEPYYQQQFVALFRVEVSKAPQELIPALETTDAQQFLAQFQASLRASSEQLLAKFADVPQLIAQIQQSPPFSLSQLIHQPLPPQLIALIQQSISEEVFAQLQQDSFSHPPHFNSQLNLRGYQGKLASLEAELDKAIGRETHPEGWGFLHHRIGRTHYFQGREVIYPSSFWRKAETSYKNALQVLKPPKFEELHLEVLQDLIRVLLDLHEIEEAQELQRLGADLLRRMLTDPKKTERQKGQLALKSASFDQLTVDLTLQLRDISGALELAERGKNTCLRWLLSTEHSPNYSYRAQTSPERSQNTASSSPKPSSNLEETRVPSPPNLGDLGGETSSQIQKFLNDSTAAIYWHLSPSRLTAFLILPGETVPVVVGNVAQESPLETKSEETSRNDQRPASLLQMLAWEEWLKDWNKQYEDYGGLKGKKKRANLIAKSLSATTETERAMKGSKASTKDHSWRTGMKNRLQRLGQILNIPNLKQILQERAINNLILIPHRDLHRLPLHYLLDEFNCTYLPCVRMGLDLLGTKIEKPLEDLLLVENPSTSFQRLPFAEVEAALIRQMFTNITHIENKNAHHAPVKQALSQAHQVFHFTGHGAYKSNNPTQSCLFLSGKDQFTLGDIVDLDLSAYQLVTLAACETAVTGNQTITDEYVGLVSGFLKAGVSHVLSTLWKVESEASSYLVVEFYQQLQGGKTPVTALKTAQDWLKNATREDLIAWLEAAMNILPPESVFRESLESRCRKLRLREETAQPYSHPYYWAAFTLSGL